MEVQLQELIDKIKQDGVNSAEKKAAEIIKAAEEKADSIKAEAEEAASAMTKKAQEECALFEKAAISSIQQAGRNTLISFRECLAAELDSLIRFETNKAYDSSVLQNLIPEAVKEWIKKENTEDLSVILSEKDAQILGDAFLNSLKAKVSGGIELKSDSRMRAGFRIGTKDGGAYYDFSAEAVAAMFSSFMSSKTAQILKSAAKEIN